VYLAPEQSSLILIEDIVRYVAPFKKDFAEGVLGKLGSLPISIVA
jgi:hypothetical protein